MTAILEMPAQSNTRIQLSGLESAASIPGTPEGGAFMPKGPQGGEVAPGALDRIVLTGFMGAGKTTVGGLLAERLGWRFLDLDREIERRDGRFVPGIFAESGEAHFRRLESRALAALLGERRMVLALGGGAPEELGNRLLLEQTPHTTVIYLCAPLATLLERCRKEVPSPEAVDRPLLVEADSRFRARHPLYERMAGHRIETALLTSEQVVSAILETLRTKL